MALRSLSKTQGVGVNVGTLSDNDLMQIGAPVFLLLSLSLLFDMPEIGVFIAAVAYLAPVKHKAEVIKLFQSWLKLLSIPRVYDNLRSQLFYVLGAVLSVCVFFGQVPLAMILATAVAYLGLEKFGKRAQRQPHKADKVRTFYTNTNNFNSCHTSVKESKSKVSKINVGVAPEVAPPMASSIEGEIQQLVRNSTPSLADEHSMRRLASLATKCIATVVPEAEVTCSSQANFDIMGAAGEKPEVNMVVTVDPKILRQRLTGYFKVGQSKMKKSLDTLLPEVLHKTATKVLSERLTFAKFWRSQFSGPEPLIVLLIPQSLGVCNYALRLYFSVNSPFPLRIKTMVSKSELRVKELILLVTRWARQRAVCNMSRGQPHLYAWSTLVVYFTRVLSSDIVGKKTCELFQKFVEFYMAAFEPNAPLLVSFSKPVAEPNPGDKLWGIPYIEDPFEPEANLGEHMTADGVVRVKEELVRANGILSRAKKDGTLAELLERWMPPSAEGADEP